MSQITAGILIYFFFACLCLMYVYVCAWVFACDVSGSVPVYQGEKPGYFSAAYNMIQEIMS